MLSGVDDVALGFRTHLGWAAAVAVAGTPGRLRVVERCRLELVDPGVPESHEPYHAGEALAPGAAAAVVKRGADAVRCVARRTVRDLARRLERDGHRVVAVGLLMGAGRPLPALEKILASHAWVHTAEGELMRRCLTEASERCGLAVTGLREKQAWSAAAEALRTPETELRERVDALRGELGSPWRQDQKLAALAGWVALRAHC